MPVFADWLPNHCLRTTVCRQGIQLGSGFANTEDTFPPAEKIQVPMAAATTAIPCLSQGSIGESDRDVDLVSSPKKPIQSAFYEKRGDKGLLLFKKKKFL